MSCGPDTYNEGGMIITTHIEPEIIHHQDNPPVTFISVNETCVTGQCYFCKTPDTMCRADGIVEASITYWVPRHMKLFTYPPGYMPYSTPRMDVYV